MQARMFYSVHLVPQAAAVLNDDLDPDALLHYAAQSGRRAGPPVVVPTTETASTAADPAVTRRLRSKIDAAVAVTTHGRRHAVCF